VLAVHAGSATVHLGATQARTVKAGEVVRVPAHVVHWVENRGGDPVRAVAAYATATVVTHA
jgi:mannose-6-phosphate isomerase-like protein (cupin superfamily)